jgi:hypothetical protein
VTQPDQPSFFSSRQGRVVIIGLILVGLAVVAFFGFRAFRSYMQIRQHGLTPGVTDVEAIRGWMTIPYIAKAYGVPEDYLFAKIGIPAEGNRDKSLGDLNFEYAFGKPGAIIEAVKETIREYQTVTPTPPGPASE